MKRLALLCKFRSVNSSMRDQFQLGLHTDFNGIGHLPGLASRHRETNAETVCGPHREDDQRWIDGLLDHPKLS